MKTIRKADDRGHARFGWLDSRHTFSFGDYYDPDHMGFGALRVINDDRVVGGAGFPTHPHRDMEIVSYVLDGALEHKDSMGNGSIIRPGDVQRMSAGTGVLHSEYNPSKQDGARFLQIWIVPERSGLSPGYEQKHFTENDRTDQLRLVASQDGRDGSVTVHQDAAIYATVLTAGKQLTHALGKGRRAWLQVARGEVSALGVALKEGDGLAIENEDTITLESPSRCEVLLFDLA